MSKKTIVGKRINFATSKILEYPDLLEVQLKSFKDFFQLETSPENRKNEGLYRVFQEVFPIEDTRNSYKLEFIDYFIDPPQYSIEECLEREYLLLLITHPPDKPETSLLEISARVHKKNRLRMFTAALLIKAKNW